MSVEEWRQVARQVQIIVDECRQIKKILFYFRKSETWTPLVVAANMKQWATSVCKLLLTLAKPICLKLGLMYVNSN